MASPISGLSSPVIAALGWALLHFLWQGGVIAAIAAIVLQFCVRAQTRYLIGLAALVVMLAAPVITFFSLDDLSSTGIVPVAPWQARLPSAFLSWLVAAWICGVAIFALRFAAGLSVLARWPRRHSREAGAQLLALCHAVQQRLGISRAIRYLECHGLTAPAGFGLLRPVILLPAAALIGLSEEQLRAVIAHELAHVMRGDFAVNLFQTLVETLLFYHPAIWWLNKRIRAEREICCDEIAVTVCGNRLAYAHALVALAEGQGAPSLAMAIHRGGLARRVSLVLGDDGFKPGAFAAVLAASLMVLLLSFSSGNLLLAASHAVSARIHRPVRAIAIYMPEHFPADAIIASAQRPRFLASVIHIRTRLTPIPWPRLPPAATPNKDVIEETISASPPDMAFPLPALPMPVAERYPAPALPLGTPNNLFEWERQQISDYCDRYAQQTVRQGANQPLVVDDAARERYGFFYWRCAMHNGMMRGEADLHGPAYAPLGAASSDQPASFSGTWAVAFGPFPAARSCSFAQTGNVLSGACDRAQGGGAAHGVVDGRQVRWTWTYTDDQKLPAEIDFIGMLGTDGAISGQAIQSPQWTGHQTIQSFTAHPGAANTQVASQ